MRTHRELPPVLPLRTVMPNTLLAVLMHEGPKPGNENDGRGPSEGPNAQVVHPTDRDREDTEGLGQQGEKREGRAN